MLNKFCWTNLSTMTSFLFSLFDSIMMPPSMLLSVISCPYLRKENIKMILYCFLFLSCFSLKKKYNKPKMFMSSDFGIQIYLLNSITVNLHTLLEQKSICDYFWFHPVYSRQVFGNSQTLLCGYNCVWETKKKIGVRTDGRRRREKESRRWRGRHGVRTTVRDLLSWVWERRSK